MDYGLFVMGTLDNHVVAIDRATGEEVWRVEAENAKQCRCNTTSAPLAVKDILITGVTGGNSAHHEYLNAFDATTGRHRWRFWTIPRPGEPRHDTWEGESWHSGGGSTCVIGTCDPELNPFYWAVGHPAADFYGGDRERDNLYTDSIAALGPDTGEPRNYYQQILRTMCGTTTPSAKSFYSNWSEGVGPRGGLIGHYEPVVGQEAFICSSIGEAEAGITGPVLRDRWRHPLERCRTTADRLRGRPCPTRGMSFPISPSGQ